MNTRPANGNRLRWPRRGWIWGGALVALLLFVAWLAPRRVAIVESLESPLRWRASQAPPRRTVVWEPAEKIEAPFDNAEARASLIRPQLDEHGTMLYFTLRKADGTSDIYRARLVRDKWQPAEPVAELNSQSDDVGPVISRDGATLYFYSDRAGGQGGFDLYTSQRKSSGWGKPRNLGPRINSPAHEYDPAISPDGLRLFFASNRSPKMHERLEAGDKDKPWRTTLRADQGLAKFDLYQARRDSADKEWQAAHPLAAINRPDSNEGAPYVSASGSFLYFNSDRPERRGEEANFDLYRAKLRNATESVPYRAAPSDKHDDMELAENLGTSINTAANELEPALSAEGFRLYFSRSRESQGEPGEIQQYDLYASNAAEVEEVLAWDNSRLSALAGNLWWMSMVLLLVALLASLVWYGRRVSFRRLSVSGFLLIAIFTHLLLGTSSFFVYFGDEIVKQVKRELGEKFLATNDNILESSGPTQEKQPDYEKVADLTSPETIETRELPRQITEAPNVPVPTRTNVPQIAAALPSEPPPVTRPLPATPEMVTQSPSTPKLERRNLTRPVVAEPVELAQTAPAERPAAEAAPKSVDVAVTQRTAPQPSVVAPPMTAKSTPAPTPDASRLVKEQATPTAPPVAPPPTALARAAAARPLLADVPPLNAEPVAPAGAPSQEATVERADVAVARKEAAPTAMVPVGTRPLKMPADVGPTLVESGVRMEAKAVPLATVAVPTPLPIKRAGARPSSLADEVAVALAEPNPAPTTATDAPATTAPAVVTVAKTEMNTTLSPKAPMPAGVAGIAPSKPEAGQSPATPAIVPMSSPTAPSGVTPPTGLARRGPAAQEIATAEVALEGIAGPTTPPADPLAAKTTGAAEVSVARRDMVPVVGPTSKLPALGGPHRDESAPLLLGTLERQAVSTPLSSSPIESRIARLPTRGFAQKFAEDAIRLQGLLRLRQADGETKRDLLARSGADERTLATIQLGLNWMQAHQHADGHWSLDEFNKECGRHGGQPCTGLGTVKSDTAATGFALLPYLGDGHTHRAGKHQAVVAKGIKWLVDHQRRDADPNKDGELYTDNPASTARMYSHGIATIALCEAYAMSRDEALKEPAQRALRFIVNSQNKTSGGWRYQPGIDADTSVVGWQIMALKSGQMAELDVPEETLTLTRKFLASVAGQGNLFGQFGYQPNNRFTPAMTAEALLCLEYLGIDRNDPALKAGAQHLLNNLPQRGKETSYYWYYGTQCMYHMQGETWRKWNAALSPALIDSQIRTGEMAGGWLPEDARENPGGVIMSTSLRVLMLEVNYRHLPLFQVLDAGGK